MLVFRQQTPRLSISPQKGILLLIRVHLRRHFLLPEQKEIRRKAPP